MSDGNSIDAQRAQELLLLGEIHGIVQSLKEGQDTTNQRLIKMESKFDAKIGVLDDRLRVVEQRAAVMGAFSGGAMAIGTALIIEGLKHWVGRGGQGN